jgi:hypothetical protein
MKKLLLSIVAVVAISSASFAQGRFSVGAELGLPMGDFGDAAGIGFGGSLRYEGTINDNLNWTGTLGYLTFSEKDNSGLKVSMIPVQAGVKYYFTESFSGFYGAAELGVHMVKSKFEGEFFGVPVSVSESSTEFSFAPALGYHLGAVDVALRYQIVSDANYLGVRLAYVFGGE